MKRIFLFAMGFSLLTTPAPALALADTSIPIGQTPLQIMTTVAALEAQESVLSSGRTLACAALTSKTSVKVNEPFALAWGSVGATQVPGGWTQNGATMVTISHSGAWTYSFTFYSAIGGSTACSAKIIVTA